MLLQVAMTHQAPAIQLLHFHTLPTLDAGETLTGARDECVHFRKSCSRNTKFSTFVFSSAPSLIFKADKLLFHLIGGQTKPSTSWGSSVKQRNHLILNLKSLFREACLDPAVFESKNWLNPTAEMKKRVSVRIWEAERRKKCLVAACYYSQCGSS